MTITIIIKIQKIKFIQKNEEEKKQLKEIIDNNNNSEEEFENDDIQNEVNDTILDVFVPYSRLARSLQLKLESINIIDENQEFEKDFILEEKKEEEKEVKEEEKKEEEKRPTPPNNINNR